MSELEDGELELVAPLVTLDLGLSLADEFLGDDMPTRFPTICAFLELEDEELELALDPLMIGLDEDEDEEERVGLLLLLKEEGDDELLLDGEDERDEE